MTLPQCCYLAKGAKRPSHTTNMQSIFRLSETCFFGHVKPFVFFGQVAPHRFYDSELFENFKQFYCQLDFNDLPSSLLANHRRRDYLKALKSN